MELQCPGCQKRLSIADQFAGQLVKCPLCASMFSAPALAPKVPGPAQVPPPTPTVAPPAPPPPSPPPSPPPIPFASEPAAPPPILSAPPTSSAAAEPEPTTLEPVTTRDFTQTRTCRLRPDILRWITPACVTLLFLLAFFPWMGMPRGQAVTMKLPEIAVDPARAEVKVLAASPVAFATLNLWELAFGDASSVIYIIYSVFAIFLMLPLVWVKLAFEKGWVPIPDALMRFWPWRSALVGGLLLFAFLFPLVHYLQWNFVESFNPMALGMKLSMRVHLVALVACAAELWIELRKRHHLPLPEVTVRW